MRYLLPRPARVLRLPEQEDRRDSKRESLAGSGLRGILICYEFLFSGGGNFLARALKAKFPNRFAQPLNSRAIVNFLAGFYQERGRFWPWRQFAGFAQCREFRIMLESPVHIDATSLAIFDVVIVHRSTLWTLGHLYSPFVHRTACVCSLHEYITLDYVSANSWRLPTPGRHLEITPVTLSAAKGLARRTQSSFAALRMTARIPLKSAHGKPSLQTPRLPARVRVAGYGLSTRSAPYAWLLRPPAPGRAPATCGRCPPFSPLRSLHSRTGGRQSLYCCIQPPPAALIQSPGR